MNQGATKQVKRKENCRMNKKFVKFAGKTLCREKNKHTELYCCDGKEQKKIHWNQQTENKRKELDWHKKKRKRKENISIFNPYLLCSFYDFAAARLFLHYHCIKQLFIHFIVV